MPRFTDMHCHFIYGVDDGAQSREDMYAMLDAAHRDGVTDLFATSHVTPGIKSFPYERYYRHLDMAQAYCDQKGYQLELYPGAEILYTPALLPYLQRGDLPSLNGSAYLLVEFVPNISLKELETALMEFENSSYTPILAHIERYQCLYQAKSAFKFKENYDIRYQVNCQTLIKGLSFFKNLTLKHWFSTGLIDFVSSDAHNTSRRPSLMTPAYEVLIGAYGQDYADDLMQGRDLVNLKRHAG